MEKEVKYTNSSLGSIKTRHLYQLHGAIFLSKERTSFPPFIVAMKGKRFSTDRRVSDGSYIILIGKFHGTRAIVREGNTWWTFFAPVFLFANTETGWKDGLLLDCCKLDFLYVSAFYLLPPWGGKYSKRGNIKSNKCVTGKREATIKILLLQGNLNYNPSTLCTKQ